ncbi:MAG: hypothetical protein JXQ27_09750 [Acidobacteria bacterium]|nr:hypothetical protein [Acidobacteriota bacterium]
MRITGGIMIWLIVFGHWGISDPAVCPAGEPAETATDSPPPATVVSPAAADTDAVRRLMDDIRPLMEPNHWPFAAACLERPDIARLIRADFSRMSTIWRRISRAATIGTGSTFLILQEDAVASVFCARPEAVADMVAITGRHAFHALVLLRDPVLAEQFTARPDLFTRRLHRMVAAATPNVREVLHACQNPLLRPLLTAQPAEILRLVECAGETAPAALAALCQPELQDAFHRNPSETVTRLCRLPHAANFLGENVWRLMRSPPLAALLLQAPETMDLRLNRLDREMDGRGAEACIALGNPSLGKWLVANPDACLGALRQLTDIAGLDAPELMSLLAHESVGASLVADPPEFIERVRRLSRAAGMDADTAFTALAAPEIAPLLVSHPSECLALAEEVGRAAGAAFDALRNPLLNESFRRDPAAVTDGLIQIRRVSEDHTAAVFEWLAAAEPARRFLQDRQGLLYALTLLHQALGPRSGDVIRSLDNAQLTPFFLDNPRPAVYRWQRIAHRAGDYASVALGILAEPELAELFIADPDRLYDWISRIVKGAGAGPALQYLAETSGRELWRCEPAVYLQLATVFRNMTPAAVELLVSPPTAPLIRRVLAAEPSLTTDALYGLVFSLREAARDPRLAGNAAEMTELCRRLSPAEIPALPLSYLTDSVTAAGTTAEKTALLKDMARVFDELNLANFQRYTPALLENVYGTVTRPPRADQRLALIMVSRNDPGEAFAEDKRTYRSLLDQGYNLIICESDSDRELAERLCHGGVRGDSPLAHTRRLDLLVIGGHGTADAINLGAGCGSGYDLDLSDFRWLRDLPWPDLLAPDAAVLLFSCFTGADDVAAPRKYSPAGGEHDFANIMEMFARVTERTVFAPRLATGVGWLDFGPDGNVRQVHYWDLAAGNCSPGSR